MSEQRLRIRRLNGAGVKTKEAEWPAQRGDYVILMLASLALSTVITLLIIPQLHHSLFF